jgi:hypothetical protein
MEYGKMKVESFASGELKDESGKLYEWKVNIPHSP